MAQRYPAEALDSAKFFVKQIPVDRIGHVILQRAMTRVWNAGPFLWTVGSGTSFNVTPNVAEYPLTYPTDWERAIKADLIVGNDGAQRELTIVSHLEQDDGYVGNPGLIYYSGPAGLENLVRLSPKPAAFSGDRRVTCLYKKILPIYVRDQIYTTVVPFPDDWYWVFEEAVLYEAYRYADDSRSGEMRAEGDKTVFTGQLAAVQSGLNEMRLREPMIVLTGVGSDKDMAK